MSMERALIEHCSPTLASIKVGSLFSFLSPICRELHEDVRRLNALLQKKGLTLRLVKPMKGRALCYLYRSSQLCSLLSDPAIMAYLRDQGYDTSSPERMLDTLCTRLHENSEFPHEIGLFLGYPLSDVIAFIENGGKNCLCCGCWKAYTNACAAQRCFARFSKCTEVYRRLYLSGRTLSQLTVTA